MGLMAESTGWVFGPNFATNPFAWQVAHGLFDPLFAKNESGVIEPFLAEGFEYNDDNTVLTVTLRPDVFFHDGTPVDASAVKAWFDEIMTGPDSVLAGLFSSVESTEVVDELTVTFTLSAPFAALTDLWTEWPGMIFSPEAYAEMGVVEAGSNPVGSGPFVFSSWLPDSELVLERNPDYWREGLPYLDRVTYRILPDEDSRMASLESGDIDIMETVAIETIGRLMELPDDEFGVDVRITNQSDGLVFNTTSPPLDDVRVRRALVHGIDTTAVIEAAGGTGIVENPKQYFGPDSPFYSMEAAEAYPDYDPTAAQQLVDEYLQDPERSDGKAVGEPIGFSYLTLSDPSAVSQAVLIQQMWEAIGAEVELEQTDAASIGDRLRGEAPAWEGTYQVATRRHGVDFDPDTSLPNLYGSLELPTNESNWTSDEVQALIATGRESIEFAERKAAYDELMRIISEELPVAYLYSRAAALAYRNGVMGVGPWELPNGEPGLIPPGGNIHVGQVWLEN